MYLIRGQYSRTGKREVVESGIKTEAEAQYLLSEYKLAFGNDWHLEMRPMDVKRLTIKKIFFEQILSGEKTFEYRLKTKKLEKMLENVDYLALDYYSKRKLIVEVLDIEEIPSFKDDDRPHFKIKLGKSFVRDDG